MKIGVNLFPLKPRLSGGFEAYVRNLLRSLFAQDAENTYCLITAPWNHQELDFGHGPYKRICIDSGQSNTGIFGRFQARIKRSHWDIYRCALEQKVDLWFCPLGDLEPRYIETPSVIAISDLQHEFYPQFFSAEELALRQLTVKPSCQMAAGVMAVSEFTRKVLVDRYGVDANRVHRIYGAAVPACNPQTAKECWVRVAQQYGLERGYLLYPADVWPHKNHELLFLALHRLRKRGLTPKLILVGAQSGQLDSLLDVARQLDCRSQVHHVGAGDDADYPGLYHGAACVVFPSLFEEFSMPLVDAMASGCAVACSDRSAIPEIVGDAGHMFDARNPDSIADALERILRNQGFRQELIEKGLHRAAMFSWKISAEETLAVFDSAHRARSARVATYVPPQEPVEGFYSDGWAAPRLTIRQVDFAQWRTLVIEGESTDFCYPLDIQVLGGGTMIDEFHLVTPSGFSRKLALPDVPRDSGLSDIQVLSSAHFVPIKLGINKDQRRLAFRIRTLELIDVEGKSMVFPGR